MGRAQNGDSEAYRVVLEEARGWLRRYFAGRIPPPNVDDLVQDTLISLHRKRATYDPQRPFLPWLAAIARYRWVDHLRREYRAAKDEPDGAIANEALFKAEVLAKISLDRMLARLSPGQAEAIRLVKIQGLSVAEAAEAAGQSESLIKVNVHRGLKRLATCIESE
jgi:RNA polymerase sigma factor (sigma-70 family)